MYAYNYKYILLYVMRTYRSGASPPYFRNLLKNLGIFLTQLVYTVICFQLLNNE